MDLKIKKLKIIRYFLSRYVAFSVLSNIVFTLYLRLRWNFSRTRLLSAIINVNAESREFY